MRWAAGVEKAAKLGNKLGVRDANDATERAVVAIALKQCSDETKRRAKWSYERREHANGQ